MQSMRLRTKCLALIALVLSGCATPNKYNWSGYDKGLYDAYKDPSQISALQIKLQAIVDALEQQKQITPPGMYAELGTLYLQEGRIDKAKIYYAKERDTWAESKTLMDMLIKNLDSRPKPSEKSKS
jgi:hypothetical protein